MAQAAAISKAPLMITALFSDQSLVLAAATAAAASEAGPAWRAAAGREQRAATAPKASTLSCHLADSRPRRTVRSHSSGACGRGSTMGRERDETRGGREGERKEKEHRVRVEHGVVLPRQWSTPMF